MRAQLERVAHELLSMHVRWIGDDGVGGAARGGQEVDLAGLVLGAIVHDVGGHYHVAGIDQDPGDGTGTTAWLPDAVGQPLMLDERQGGLRWGLVQLEASLGVRVPAGVRRMIDHFALHESSEHLGEIGPQQGRRDAGDTGDLGDLLGIDLPGAELPARHGDRMNPNPGRQLSL